MNTLEAAQPLLGIRELYVHFPVRAGAFGAHLGTVRAVDGVDLTVRRGETVALVGESGCGKTTLARSVVGLNSPVSGRIELDGIDLAAVHSSDRRAVRRRVQMIFQDPFESLNPRKTVLQTLAQPLLLHGIVPRAQVRDEATRLLETVELRPAAQLLGRYPHEFSGGQRQRLGIARALAPRPDVLIADEAVSALDISIRAQVLVLLQRIQRELGLGFLFITHDLGVVRSLAHRVAVMYLGQIVEEGLTEDVFDTPKHPYTRALLAATPVPDPLAARAPVDALLAGELPSPMNPPSGCRFRTRCPLVEDICSTEPEDIAFERGHVSRCHFAASLTGTSHMAGARRDG